jgi:GPH family glycoside/pentoside/hexuronide:cation symporter
VIQALATGAMLAGVAYVSRWVLVEKSAATILFVCFVGPALLLTPAWGAMGRRVGKKRGYVVASLVLALAALLLGWSRSAPSWWVFAATALVGVGYAGIQVFPMAMLPDAAAMDARRTGSNRAGVYTGVWTAGETLGLALGPAVYALVLAMGHYRSADLDDGFGTGSQPGSAITAIVLGFSLIPCALVLLSLVPLSRFSLTAADVQSGAVPVEPDPEPGVPA